MEETLKEDTLFPTMTSNKTFRLLAMETIGNMNKDLKIDSAAVRALQVASEIYISQFFEDSFLLTRLSGRKQLTYEDMKLCTAYRKEIHEK